MTINIKKLILVTLGVVIMSIGLYYFLVPEDLAVGGVTGLAIVINNFCPKIPIGVIMIISNIVLFTLSFLVIGKDFGGYTIFSSFLISFIIYILEKITPLNAPIIDDLLINLIYGIIIQGIGMAIIFSQDSSTGGTDIIAKIINKFTHLEIGKALFLSDCIIVVLAGLSFGLKLGLYALLGVLFNAFIIDNVINKINKKINIVIISQKSKEINDFIINEINRGTTIFYADGGFSKKNKTIINTVVSKKEYIKIKNYAQKTDPTVFITMGEVNEVLGGRV